MKIIALPFAGGNIYSFKELEKYVPNTIEWVTLELPGRGSRFGQPILENIDSMVNDLFSQLKPHLNEEPYMIYGHSLGTLLGYELTKMLVKFKCQLPECLYFTGRGAPGTQKIEKKSELPKDKFWKQVEEMGGLPSEILEHEELLELQYPILKADFKALEEYNYEPMDTPFSIPIFICMGEDEIGEGKNKTLLASVRAWSKETKFLQKVECIPGNHFFILAHPKEVTSRIVNAFQKLVKSPTLII